MAGNIWPAVLALVVTPYIVHGFGLATYGVYAIWVTILGILAVLDIGSYAGLINSLAALSAKGQSQRIQGLVWAVSLFYLIMGSVVWIMFCGTGYFLGLLNPGWLGDEISVLKVAPLVGGIFFMTFLASPGTAYLVATQRYDILNRVNLISRSVVPLGIVGVLMLGGRLAAVLAFQLGVSFLTTAVLWWLMRHFMNPSGNSPSCCAREDIRALIRFSIPTFFSNVVGTMHLQMNRLIVSWFQGAGVLPYYSVPEAMGQRYHGLVANALNVVFPLASSFSATKENAAVRRMFYGTMLLVVQTAVPFSIMMSSLAFPFLTYWMGPDFAASASRPMAMLCVGYAMLGMSVVPFYVSWGAGWAKVNAGFSLTIAIANGVLAFFLVPRFGVTGGAAAFLLSGTINAAFILFVERKAFRSIDFGYWFGVLGGAGAAGLAQCAVTVFWLAPRVNGLAVVLFAMGVSCAVFYFVFWGLGFLLGKGWWPGAILRIPGSETV